MGAVAAEAAHPAAQDGAAIGGEALGQGRHHLVGIDGVHAVRIVDAAHDAIAEARRQRAGAVAVDDLELRALGPLQGALLLAGGERRLALVDVERAFGLEEFAQARRLDLGLPGDVGLGHQRDEGIDALPDLGRAVGGARETRHPGQQPGQAGRMDGERAVAIHQHLGHALQGRGPGQRQHVVDGDEARIAVGGGPAGLGAVEQRDGVAGPLQGAGGRRADDAGADDDDGLIAHEATLARPMKTPGRRLICRRK